MLCRRKWWLFGAAWMLAACGVAHGATSEGQRYLALCRQYAVRVSGGPAASPSASPTAWEVKGTLSGLARSTDDMGYTLLVQMDDGTSVSLTGSGKAPNVDVGSKVRVLVKNGSANTESPGPVVLAVATETDVVAALGASNAAALHAPASHASRRSRSAVPASRGARSAVREAVAWSASAILQAYKNAVRWFNPKLSENELTTIAQCVLGFSARYGVDPRLIMAVLAVESGFKVEATSRAGAMGLGQLMPATARGMGVTNAYDPVQNIDAAVRLIRGHLEAHAGKDSMEQLALALASYNAGGGAVRKYGGVPPYKETRNYIRKVASWYRYFCTGK